MNWELAIKRNRGDLAKIIAGLFVLAGWVPGGERPTFLRRAVRNELIRLLRVSEAALRRLIVIYATVHKTNVSYRASTGRPLPDFSSFGKGGGTRAPVFNLIDPRKPIRFIDEADWHGEQAGSSTQRIWTVDEPRPLVGDLIIRARTLALRQAQDAYAAAEANATSVCVTASADGSADALAENEQSDTEINQNIFERHNADKILRRLEALNHALKNLPRQAKRMAKIIEETGGDAEPEATRKSNRQSPLHPIRVGYPPGHRKEPEHGADHVLRECHGLVCDLSVGIP